MLADASLSVQPAVLLDAITFHLIVRVSKCGQHPLDTFRQALVRSGALKPGSRGKAISLIIPVSDGQEIKAELFPSAAGEGIILGVNRPGFAGGCLV